MIDAIERAVGRLGAENQDAIRGVMLIGSFARREQLADSDVDLAVLLEDGIARGRRIEVTRPELWRTALEAEGVPNQVDLVSVNSADLDFDPASTPGRDPLSLSHRIKLLDVAEGSFIRLCGEDFSEKVHPPTRPQLLQGIEYALAELRAVNAYPREALSNEEWGDLIQWTLLVGIGDYYLEKGEWLAKGHIAQRSETSLVREAWEVRSGGGRPGPESPLLDSQTVTEWAQRVDDSLQIVPRP